ncbi:MAG TPA: VCBS repeat-containing protein [Thermoplasmata archaeon]|nr:VCBS repeat-containing protein [Thermoplasmata archaeon]
MKVVLREDESGISEVIGTILILAMTVVLFSTIIIWVGSIPTPVAQTRLDVQSALDPIYNNLGVEIGINITLLHQGGEALQPAPTIIYVTSQRGTNPAKTDIVRLHVYNRLLVSPNGLLDGKDSVWSVGERWSYKNTTLRSSDAISVTIIDTLKSLLLWTSTLNPPVGSRPPVFVDKWADGLYATTAIDPVQSGLDFYIFAKVADPDNDLNSKSVYATITAWYGTPDPCSKPQPMRDDGLFPDRVAGDGEFALGGVTCMKSPYPSLSWAGSIILFNATDLHGHATQSRMTLNVIQGPNSGGGGGGINGTGRPSNLRWNGRQGYNIFNASQWDQFKYTAKETRTFKANDQIVVVIGSLDLENTFDTDKFTLYDPFSGFPSQPVVYGTSKGVTQSTTPSSNQAFTFLEFINGYYIYTYRFKLNAPSDPQVGTNYYKVPLHPPSYFFAKYTLDILLFSSSAVRFNTTDSVTITDTDGYVRDFPQVQTFKDAAFTQATTRFNSTDVAYVQMKMFTTDATITNVVFGNVIIKDYAGGTQLMRAPVNGHDTNVPICPVAPPCSGTAVTINGGQRVYRFAINFTQASQDPWVEGIQNYALTLSSIRDGDESYANVATQLVVVAPLYKLDVVAGTDAATNNAWGTKDYSYYYENLNGLDRWRTARIEFCGLSGTCKNGYHTIAIVNVDFDRDGDLDTVSSLFVDNSNGQIVLDRRDLDNQGNVVFTRFVMENLASIYCNALAVGDVTGDGAPEVICGASNGNVWYYKNDGSWQNGAATKVIVDQSRSQSITSVAVGDFNGDGANDIAVGGASGRLTWYPNLDKLGKFQNIGITDDWFAEGEVTKRGNVTSGSYLNTFVSDGSYEQVREYTFTEPVQSGATTNGAFTSDVGGWTYADWQDPGTAASGTWASSGGNPGGYASISTNWVNSQVVSGYFYQGFTVSGSPPFTAQLNLDWKVIAFGATGGGNVVMYAFVDTTSGAPTLGQQVWSSTAQNGATSWASVTSIDVSSKIPAAGTYYLKIAVRTQNAASGSTTTGGFDNVALTWSSTGGLASELEQYWRVTQVPNRPGTTFTFNLRARHTANTEGDNFAIAYASDVVGGDPTAGTYATVLWVNATSDTSYSYILPSSVSGKQVWIRAIDMDHTVGNTNLDTLFADVMYIRATTPSGTTGVSLSSPGDAGQVNAIDADDRNGDGFSDIMIGTANNNVFKYLGGSGGLQTPTGAFYTAPSPIVGIKMGNFSSTQSGLEVAIAFGTTVRILTGFGPTGSVIISALPSYTPGNAITALGAGDVNGDGPDDIVIGTTTDVWYWSNTNNAVSWTAAINVASIGANVYGIDLGDASKSQYVGR